MRMIVMRCVRNFPDVDQGQQREHERLHECNEYSEGRQYQRHQKLRYRRIEVCDLHKDLLVGEHVREKPDAEGEGPNRVTYDLDEKYQARDRDHQQRQFRSGKVRDMAEKPVLTETDVVVINE